MISEADEEFMLKNELREISGLSYFNDHSLLCVNDEKGTIYKFSLKKKEITKKYKFDRSGDYEGVEVVGDQVFVLRSDGNVFAVDHMRDEDILSVKNNTQLNAGNNTEGLGYDSKSNSLLIACKGNPGIDEKFEGKRAIYKYSLDSNILSDFPAFLVDQERIREILDFNGYTNFAITLLESINPSEGDVTFQPSGVAMHPITNNLYVIGSVGKLLIVLSPEGEMLAVVKLRRSMFRQPEGICFTPDGTMFISNEGKGSVATICRFNYNQ
ncbi:SdiA-regulated domain-containing protein [Labilibaculum antarcticum]|uniref:SdiA-regulated domain-containing protein n=1 Tax=Labilibaculum antarcticum TaxID=1717717 RepID=UPI0013C32F20|nr:SdiA-regulated domain-containing protein [Labilibaculum antarcticum]